MDETPIYKIIPFKEKVVIPPSGEVFGQRLGGLTANATSVQQGEGNSIFKVSEKGLQLGAADFALAPFSVTMAGAIHATSGTFSGDITGATGTFSGTLTGGSLNIPDITSANSFHVDTSGNTWWGATTFATGLASVSKDGAAIFTNIKITGVQAGSSIDGQFLAALSVASAAVAANAITTAKIAALAVTSAELAASAVTTEKIAALAVTTSEIAATAVTTAKIAALAVTASEIANSTITGGKIAANTITAGNITALTITAAEIAAGTITGAKIAATTITAANITALTITAAEIAASTITGAKIAAGTITAANITALTITAAEIAANTITAAKIAALTITAAEIAASTITAGKLSVSTLSAITADLGTITAGSITLNTANAVTINYSGNILFTEGGNIKFTSVTAPAACVATLIATATGNVDNGTHSYKVTFVNASGETELGTVSNTVTVDASNKQVALSDIPVSSSLGVTARKIYRTKAGFSNYNYLATLNDNSTTTYTDNIADSSLTEANSENKENDSFGKIFIDGVERLTLTTTNNFIGSYAGLFTTGIHNTAIGYQSLSQNTSGQNNIAIGGKQVLYQNTTGSSNIAVGYQSAFGNTTGDYNTTIGHQSLVTNSTGTNNVAIGAYAGYYETGSNAFYVNNQDRSTTAGDKAKSLFYGVFAATVAGQSLTINATTNISSLTASEIVITDGSKNIVSAAVETYPSLTELSYVKGLTSAIQTQLDAKPIFKNGIHDAYETSTASGTLNIAHGLGTTPKWIHVWSSNKEAGEMQTEQRADAWYNGTTQTANSYLTNGGTVAHNVFRIDGTKADAATIYAQFAFTWDATNIICTITKVNTPNKTVYLFWEAIG